MSTELVTSNDQHGLCRTLEETARFAEVVVRSGMFPSVRDAAQAIVKIALGRELGLGPGQSLRGIHLVQGKPELDYTVVGALIRRSGRYDYQVREHTAKRAVIAFTDGCRVSGGSPAVLGEASFSVEDAERRGLTRNPNWRTMPEVMVFARALTAGARMYCPDVFGGAVYAQGELGDGDDPVVLLDDERERPFSAANRLARAEAAETQATAVQPAIAESLEKQWVKPKRSSDAVRQPRPKHSETEESSDPAGGVQASPSPARGAAPAGADEEAHERVELQRALRALGLAWPVEDLERKDTADAFAILAGPSRDALVKAASTFLGGGDAKTGAGLARGLLVSLGADPKKGTSIKVEHARAFVLAAATYTPPANGKAAEVKREWDKVRKEWFDHVKAAPAESAPWKES